MDYTLQNEDLKVVFRSLGGTLHSIQDHDGLEYLWQGDPAYWSGRAPILFPICGSLRNDTAQIGGNKTTRMPRHGIVRKREFVCEQQEKDNILFSLESDDEMFSQYPYQFRLELRYTLSKNTIQTQYRVETLGQEEMPFFIGGHPGFNCPLFHDESFEDYWLEFPIEETCAIPTPITETGLIDVVNRTALLRKQRTLPLSHSLFSADAVILDEIQSRSVELRSGKHNKGVRLDFNDFLYLILWSSANEGPFIALEPWTGLSTCSDESDVFEKKRNVQKVRSGEKKTYSFVISIL